MEVYRFGLFLVFGAILIINVVKFICDFNKD